MLFRKDGLKIAGSGLLSRGRPGLLLDRCLSLDRRLGCLVYECLLLILNGLQGTSIVKSVCPCMGSLVYWL